MKGGISSRAEIRDSIGAPNWQNHFDDPRFNTEPIDDTETRLYRNRRPIDDATEAT